MLFILLRAALPRPRYDHLMAAGWMVCLPLTLLNLLVTGAVLLALLPAEVRARITYAGFQAPEELPRFFAQADAFVLPSRYDGWGVVVNQALGAGLPVICSDRVGAGHDLVEDGVNGLKFPAGDSAALAQQMERLVSAPELLEKWGAASREKSRDWTPAVGAGKWVEALQAVLQQ